MPSVGHAIVGLAAARAYAPGRDVPWRTTATFVALATLPDIDVLLRRMDANVTGAGLHRGGSHSLLAGAVVALAVAALGGQGRSRATMFLGAAATAASHPLMDLFTGGGAGVMLLWPWSAARFLAPVHLLPAAPIGSRYLSISGLQVAAQELALFSPLLAWLVWRRRAQRLGLVRPCRSSRR